jgi:hypothetical protein
MLLFAPMVYAQNPKDKPAETNLSLKPEVALKITQTKLQIQTVKTTEANLINQYTANTQQEQQLTTTLTSELQTALKDSGLDETKFILNFDTLAITAKPEPAKEAEKPAAPKVTPTAPAK